MVFINNTDYDDYDDYKFTNNTNINNQCDKGCIFIIIVFGLIWFLYMVIIIYSTICLKKEKNESIKLNLNNNKYKNLNNNKYKNIDNNDLINNKDNYGIYGNHVY